MDLLQGIVQNVQKFAFVPLHSTDRKVLQVHQRKKMADFPLRLKMEGLLHTTKVNFPQFQLESVGGIQ